jgi:putative FmdB family regulatory protein
MPTYEYLCQTCSHRFETWQKMTDEPLTVCPECGNSIRRVLYPAGVVFKGSGFYKTDHAEKKAEVTPSSNGEKKSSETKSGEGTSESKTSTESKSSESGGTSKSESAISAPASPSTATK